ncbi:MAG: histidine phosphatase family protein, partial [Chloroflexota bacterium]
EYPTHTIAIFSHADLIKMVVAHYLGMHLDVFQRIVISPASITGIQLGHSRPFITTVNDTAHVQELEKSRKKAEQNGKASGD